MLHTAAVDIGAASVIAEMSDWFLLAAFATARALAADATEQKCKQPSKF